MARLGLFAEVDEKDVRRTAMLLADVGPRALAIAEEIFTRSADDIAETARSRARAGHPPAYWPRHNGEYTWDEFVASYQAGSDNVSAFVQFGDDSLPGWPAWEYGSDHAPQFDPYTRFGYFIQPALRGVEKEVEVAINRLFDAAMARMFD